MAHEHATLVEQAARGESSAIESLLLRHLPGLRAFIRLRSGKEIRDQESCSDLTQSVCREVFANMDKFEYRGEAAFRAWLYGKALRKVQDRGRYYKAQKRDVRREVRARDAADDEPFGEDHYSVYYADLVSPSRMAIGREELEQVERAFQELPEEYREVVTLFRVAGLSHSEVGRP